MCLFHTQHWLKDVWVLLEWTLQEFVADDKNSYRSYSWRQKDLISSMIVVICDIHVAVLSKHATRKQARINKSTPNWMGFRNPWQQGHWTDSQVLVDCLSLKTKARCCWVFLVYCQKGRCIRRAEIQWVNKMRVSREREDDGEQKVSKRGSKDKGKQGGREMHERNPCLWEVEKQGQRRGGILR